VAVQRALRDARGRARREAALREAAEALAAAFTVEEVTRQIARTALGAMPARGAFVEEIVAAAGEEAERVVVRAAAGDGVPAVGSAVPFAGSYMERVLAAREPVIIADVVHAERPSMAAATAEPGCSAIVVPLGNAAAPIGALFVVSDPRTLFTPDHLTRADTFGHLAALAYEKVRLLDEAREGRAELERVMSSRSRLMRGFSHDVKNPLGAADGYAALLSDGIFGPLDAAQAAGIERIRGCIRTALGLIDDLHELARAETGNLVLSPEPLELRDLARQTGEEYRAAAEAAGLSLSVEVTREPLVVETDRARVRQVVSNLLSNAIKYTDAGSVTLRTRREPADDAGETGGWAAIDVSDTGRGIPPGQLDVIFDEFTRVGTDDRPGAGLGLAISQKLAQAMGGRISVRSEVGRGSTFTLRLPFPGPGDPVPPAAPGGMAGASPGTLAP
jgi:signal transduction histidine kinase